MNLTAAYTRLYTEGRTDTLMLTCLYTLLYIARHLSAKTIAAQWVVGGFDPTVCMNEISYMIINQLSQPHELISAASHAVPLPLPLT